MKKDITIIKSEKVRKVVSLPYVHENGLFELIIACFCSRGSKKGYLLNNPPNHDAVKAAWLGIMLNVAPVRVGMCSMFFMRDEVKGIFEKTDNWASNPTVKFILNKYAQRPFQFNLFHYHNPLS